MKNVRLNLVAIAAIFAAITALAMRPRYKAGMNYVYMQKFGGNYQYYNFSPFQPHFEVCLANAAAGSCTFTSTKTAGYFNSVLYSSAPPPVSTVTPVVSYPGGAQAAYQRIN